MRLDVGEFVGRIQQRIEGIAENVTGNAKTATELLDILRDTHRILRKLEVMVDRVDETAREWEGKLADVNFSAQRIDRLERAVLNIERATMAVEATMGALPRALRARISERGRRLAAGEGFDDE